MPVTDRAWFSFAIKRRDPTLQSIFSSERIAPLFARRVLLPATLVTVLALALGVFALYWAVDRSNNISVERQLKSTERYIRAIVGELAQQQEMVAVWDDTVQEVSKPDLDEVWLDANIGGWLHKTFGQDRVFILNATTNRSTQRLTASASIPKCTLPLPQHYTESY